ncbi:MAG: VOC family protein [Phycisphaerae bacterium]|nr:VOC family protein [Phycisphaerae bacterium]
MANPSVQEERMLRTGTNPAGWFEIPTRDIERARTFYERTFGIQLTSHTMGEYEMLMFPDERGKPGAGGCLSKGPTSVPCDKGTLLYLNVTSIESVLERAMRNGGKVVQEKTSIGEHGFFAILEDPDGNHLGVHMMP